MPSTRAISAACPGPPPPAASSVKRRTSRPRSVETVRTARPTMALASERIAKAASSREIPSGFRDIPVDSFLGEAAIEPDRAGQRAARR